MLIFKVHILSLDFHFEKVPLVIGLIEKLTEEMIIKVTDSWGKQMIPLRG